MVPVLVRMLLFLVQSIVHCSSIDIDKNKKDILILGKVPTDG